MVAAMATTLAVIAALGVFALSLMTGLNERLRSVINENIAELVAVSDVRAALSDYRQLQLNHVDERSPTSRSRIAVDLVETRRAVEGGIEVYRKVSPGRNDGETAERLLAPWRRYLRETEPALALSQRNQRDQARAIISSGPADATFTKLRNDLRAAHVAEQDHARVTYAAGKRAFTTARMGFTVALLASLIVIGGIGLWLLVILPFRRAGASESYRRRFQHALDMADTEEEALDIVGRSLRQSCSGLPVELLLADSSHAHLNRALVVDPEVGAPGCPVDAPRACEAIRRGQTTVFSSSENIDACPKLRDRSKGPCSAVCTPVTVLGRTIGVLHAVGPVGSPPRGRVRDVLETTGTQTGSRLGVIRAMGQSQLQASTDPLTGLLNRRSLEDRVQDLRRAQVPFVVVMADLDHFKLLNDAHGHETGDRALRLFTRTMEETVRTEDIVARYGGEEFVIVMPRCSMRQAAQAMDRARAALKEALASGDVPDFTFSAGLAEAGPDETLHGVLRAADEALMGAKRSGRDRVLIASSIRVEQATQA